MSGEKALRSVGHFFVGVRGGDPIVKNQSDEAGECQSIELYSSEAEALARYHNVRRVYVEIDDEPIRAPESWGEISR